MKIRSPLLTKVIVTLAVAGLRLLLATCRKVMVAPSPQMRFDYVPGPDDPERFVLCVWHDELLIPAFCGAQPQLATCLVSRHQDGSFLAEALTQLGFGTVRGSSRKGAALAARQMLEQSTDRHLVITPDGPGGPRRQMKSGAVYFASATGRRLVVSAFACERCWRIAGSWTDQMIPKPFTTIYLVAGEPLTIPSDLDDQGLAAETQRVQRAMEAVEQTAADFMAGRRSLDSDLAASRKGVRRAA